VISHGNSIIEAARQARLSVGLAIEAGVHSLRYGSTTEMTGLLPQSVEDARKLVRRVLGALVDYDTAHSTELTATLFTFLENNRALRRTAAELNIHRQTLVYRLGERKKSSVSNQAPQPEYRCSGRHSTRPGKPASISPDHPRKDL